MKKTNPGAYGKQNKKKINGDNSNTGIAISAAAGVLFLLALIFSHGSIGGFLKALVIEAGIILALIGVAVYISIKYKRSYGKSKGKRAGQQPEAQFMESLDNRYERSASAGYQPIKKNFNWIVKDSSKKNEVKASKPEAEIKEEQQTRKFTPYRSPFERINPPRQVNEAEPDNAVKAAGEKAAAPLEAKQDNLMPSFDDELDDSNQDEIYEHEFAVNDEPGVDEEFKISFDEAEEHADEFTGLNFEEYTYDPDSDVLDDTEDEVEDGLFNIQFEDQDVMEENHSAAEDQVGAEEEVEEKMQFTAEAEAVPAMEAALAVNPIYGQKGKVVEFRQYSTNREKADKPYPAPSMDLLRKHEELDSDEEPLSHTEYNANKLIETLASFGVGARVVNISEGPAVTRYELQPNVGVKVSKIVNLADDIALNLAAIGVRIEAPIPGKAAVGIEVPNKEITPVFLRDVIESEEFLNHPSKLAFAVGKDIAGNTIVADIAKMPHLLIAGATGSGKSVCINTLISSILYKASPSEVKLLMVDPKVVELSIYNGIPHLLIPVVTDAKKAAGALGWAVLEMTNRYRLFAENNVRDLKGYNAMLREKGERILPQIVIIIDELADLMMVAPNDVEDCICRLAQMARAAGMHLVIATQRPSVDVITGVIKANVPSRISFAVSSQIDSRTILDMAGAEKLLGRGDMLFSPIGEPKPKRVQGAFISDKEVESIVAHIKSQYDSVEEYDEEIIQKIEKQVETPAVETNGDDELLSQAIDIVIEQGQASTSLIQRKLKVGYARAARILDQMETWGVVGPSEGSKPRQVKVTKREWAELNS